MSRKQQVEYPGIGAFAALMILSVLYFLLADIDVNSVGAFLVLWGFFALVRILWLSEAIATVEDPHVSKRSRILPWVILSTMDQRKRLERGRMALRSINKPVLVWFLLGLFYIITGILVSLSPQPPGEYLQVEAMIDIFFESSGRHEFPDKNPYFQHQLRIFGQLMMIGFVFWLAQTYAYSQRYTDVILWVSLMLFMVSLFVNITAVGAAGSVPLILKGLWHGYGWGHLEVLQTMQAIPDAPLSSLATRIGEIGIGGTVFLYTAGGLSALMYLRGFFSEIRRKLYALLGLGILLLVLMCDTYLIHSTKNMGLWLSGWAMLGVLWVRTGSIAQKLYRINQL